MKKKVAFMIPGLKNGGAERVLSTISLNLNKNIVQYIFTWNAKKIDYDYDGEIIDFNIDNSSNIIKNIAVLIKRIRMAKKYKEKYKIDTCISHLEGANIVNILSKGAEKVIITVHNFQSMERKGGYGFIFKVLIRLLYNRADKIIAVSEEIKNDLVNNFKINFNKVEVIYNPFDVERIKLMSHEKVKEDDIFNNPTIINVGRLTKQKGQCYLINIINNIKKDIPNIKLLILGKGELESEIREQINKYKLEENVILLGFKSNPFKYIRKSNIFALTSLYEGFPMCLVEAMACETPVISVDCKSGPREILCDKIVEDTNITSYSFEKYGVLTRAFAIDDKNSSYSEKVYAEAIIKLLNDKERMREYEVRGIERANELDVKHIIKLWEELI